MKLLDCVIQGRFCGLNTVEEAILMIEAHYDIFPFSEVEKEFAELYIEYDAWKNGELELDEEFISKELDRLNKTLDELYEKAEDKDLDMNCFVKSNN